MNIATPQEQPEQEPGTDLVTLEEEEGFLTHFNRRASAAITTIAGDTEESALLRINCTAPAIKRLSKLVGAEGEGKTLVLEVKHFFLHAVKRVSEESGEVFIGPRLVLVTPKDETIVTSSKAIAELMAHALSQFKGGPWEPPVRLEAFSVRSSNGHDYTAGRLLPRVKSAGVSAKTQR